MEEKYVGYFSNAIGSCSLHVNMHIALCDMIKRCEELYDIYLSDSYKSKFKHFLDIHPINDEDMIEDLDKILLESLNSKNDEIYVSIPEKIDYEKIKSYRLKGNDHEIEVSDFNMDNCLYCIEDSYK